MDLSEVKRGDVCRVKELVKHPRSCCSALRRKLAGEVVQVVQVVKTRDPSCSYVVALAPGGRCVTLDPLELKPAQRQGALW